MKLRIISGLLKGRMIKAPDSDLTRPTTDRVRETIFNLLNNKINFDGIFVLDFFAGSGALGFESLSRGAAKVTFVEKNYPIYKNLFDNIKALNVEDNCEIVKSDAVQFAKYATGKRFELILADPPFFQYSIYDVVKYVFENDLLADDGYFIIERSIQTLKKDVEGFRKEPFKRIGDTCLYEFTK
ncbi:MAG: 16S rRNA (guanine(966)-N(2))-methyltransferase RsmD [Ignavibacteria bacterium]|nr:16S rRNA (guanine(966)-N(2))-methyltransferase RsmD [Ignavibacteria bacterium]